MKRIKFLFLKFFLIISISFSAQADDNFLVIGNDNAKVIVKVFSSLTCPHCANFHKNIYEDLKKDYIDKKMVKFEHHSFPLDMAALNAEIVIRCHENSTKKFQLLSDLYEKQNNWAVGSDINYINKAIKKIGLNSGLENAKIDNCLKNEDAQNQILNERIEAQKKYKIQSTPTIFINDKKYDGKHEYKAFKKAIEKNL